MRQINNIFIIYPFLEVNDNIITITYVLVFENKYLNSMNFSNYYVYYIQILISSIGVCHAPKMLDRPFLTKILILNYHKLTEVIKLLGKACKYRKMYIGTKIIANTLGEYDDIIIKLESEKYQFFAHLVKANKRFKLELFGLPKVDVITLVDEFKYNFNIELASIKEIQTSRSNRNDALFMHEFSRDQISNCEVIKIKYVYGVVIHWRNPLRRSRGSPMCHVRTWICKLS